MTDRKTDENGRGPRGRFVNSPGPGRRKGQPNKATASIREAMMRLANGNVGKVQGWLDKAAEKDPGKAADLFLRLAEFCVPKLQRSEHTGEDGGPIELKGTPADPALLAAMSELGARVRRLGAPTPAPKAAERASAAALPPPPAAIAGE